jgi:hypothetical protein
MGPFRHHLFQSLMVVTAFNVQLCPLQIPFDDMSELIRMLHRLGQVIPGPPADRLYRVMHGAET